MRKPAGLLFAPLFLLTGCAQSSADDPAAVGRGAEPPVVLDTQRGMPAGMRAAAKTGRPAAAILGAGRLAVTTWGSSTCPEVPTRMRVRPAGTLRMVVRLDAKPRQVCTVDMGPSTTRLRVDPKLTADDRVPVLMVFPGGQDDLRMTAVPIEDA